MKPINDGREVGGVLPRRRIRFPFRPCRCRKRSRSRGGREDWLRTEMPRNALVRDVAARHQQAAGGRPICPLAASPAVLLCRGCSR